MSHIKTASGPQHANECLHVLQEEPILMNRLAWTRAVLQYLGQVVLAATKQQWSTPHYQLVTDVIIRLLQSLCPPAVFADTCNHGAYLVSIQTFAQNKSAANGLFPAGALLNAPIALVGN